MGRTDNAADSTDLAALAKREDCKHTEHDSAFSQWKILAGPSDWKDYLSNKEGAERYRTCNLPDCSSCSGFYELGITLQSRGKLSSKDVIPVYLGKADNVRTRIQQYGRNGAHLENGSCSNDEPDCEGPKLFSDVFSKGFAVAYRWVPTESKDAQEMESRLLKTYDYAWNRGMNGERRPRDIHQKLESAPSSAKRSELPTYNNIKQVARDMDIRSTVFKFTTNRPRMISNKCDVSDTDDAIRRVLSGKGSIFAKPPIGGRKNFVNDNAVVGPPFLIDPKSVHHLTCGITLADGSLCTREPVLGRKRCEEHKGRKTNVPLSVPFVVEEKDNTLSFGDGHHRRIDTICGVDLEDGTVCTKNPVIGRKRCEEHKGMRADSNKSNFTRAIPSVFADSGTHVPRISSTDASSGSTPKGEFSLSCRATKVDGSPCTRKPGKDGKFCWQHEVKKASTSSSSCSYNIPSIFADSVTRFSIDKDYHNTYSSLSCGAITLDGSPCNRNAGKGSNYCWQHEATRGSITYSSSQSYSYSSSSSTCGAMTKQGYPCRRRTTGGRRCHQH